MKFLREFFQAFKLGAKLTNRSQTRILYSVSALLLAATSFAMFLMNIRRELYVMAVITAILAVVLVICAYLSGIRKRTVLPSVIMAIAAAVIFSYFTNFILQTPLSNKVNTCVALIDINGLKEVNDTLGHEGGDELIRAVPYCCQKVIQSDFTLCRIGGDEFVVIINRPDEQMATLVDKLKSEGQKWSGSHSKGCQLAIGWASSNAYPGKTIFELFRTADAMMYRDKAAYYQQKGNDRRKARHHTLQTDA